MVLFCVSRLVCLRVGDIVQTSIVSWFIGRFLFSRFVPEVIALSEAPESSCSGR